jgi:chemotaxis protein MotB
MDGDAAPELRGVEGPPNFSLPAPVTQQTQASDDDAADEDGAAIDDTRLNDLHQLLREEISRSVAMEPYKDHLLLDITPQGLRIQIVDQQSESMFDVGSANLQQHSSDILAELGALINSVPNRVSISGHTDGRSYNRRDYSNWELSADRANAARRALIAGGMSAAKIGQVVGLGSSVLFDKTDPLSAVNRRISIVVLSENAEAALIDQMPEVSTDDLLERNVAATN